MFCHESYLRLIDLTVYAGVSITSGRVVEGCLTEALVLRREEQEKTSKRGKSAGLITPVALLEFIR